MFLLTIGLVVYLAFSLCLTLVLCGGAARQSRREAPAQTVQTKHVVMSTLPVVSVTA